MGGEMRVVPLDSIVVSPRRIRRDLGDVDALALSLHLHGQLAPAIVYQEGERYHLIAGERRLEATRRLHAAEVKSGQVPPDSPGTIRVLVRQLLPGENPREIELVENSQRRELTDEEEADALIRLVRDDGRDMREVAAVAGRSIAYVSKRVRMFEDPALRAALTAGQISPAVAEELLALDEVQRPEMLELAIKAGWSSKQLREAVQTYAGGEADSEETVLAPERVHAPMRTANAQGVIVERPPQLTRRILELNEMLRDLRPFQLKPADDRALRQLWATLRQLAQAPRVPRPTRFPTVAEAEKVARRGSRGIRSR
jgi:ParB/RepB/Spo0J family partition protein